MLGRSLHLFILLLTFLFATPSFAAEEHFKIDPDHSYVLWRIKHLGYSTQTGKWFVAGDLMLDKDKPENSKVTATVNIAEMITGHAKLDKHLKSKDFFEIMTFPTATFESNKVVVEGKNKAKIYGTLKLHGVSKPVIIDATLNKAAVNPMNNKMTAGFHGSTKLKRSDFGITQYLPNLGDDVPIEIEIEATKNNNEEPARE